MFHGKSRMICALSLMNRAKEVLSDVTGAKHSSYMRLMSVNRQWKVVDERDSGNIFADDH
jgi:hypothetical protein